MSAVICLRGAVWRLYPCKLWAASKNRGGYGNKRCGDRTILLHREALTQRLGRAIRPGLLALHHCDVRNCYEPEHLYEGTHADNNRDCMERGRWRGRWPMIPEDVRLEITRRYVAGASIKSLANEFGVGQGSVGRAVPKHLHRPTGPADMPEHTKEYIRSRYAAGGVTLRSLATELGMANSTIHRVIAMGRTEHA